MYYCIHITPLVFQETMVTSMEEEVKVLQAELNSVQEERRQLEMQKKLLTCTAPAIAGKGVNT